MLTAYLPLWLADRGVSADAIGAVLGLAALSRVVTVPGWGWVADRLGRLRLMLFAAAAVSAVCAAALPAAPGLTSIAVLVIVGGTASTAMTPLADALTLTLAAARRLDYGRTRAWGSVSYMLTTAGAGALLGYAGSVAVPWLIAGGYGAAALLARFLPDAADRRSLAWFTRLLAQNRATRDSILREGALMSGPGPLPRRFRLVLLASALIQGSHAAYYGFASLHWRQAGIPDGGIGLLIAEGIVAEIALFIWGRRWVEAAGPARLTAVAACGCLVRWTVTGLTTALPVLIAVQFLHAATFACQHLSSMLVLRALPPGRAGMAQSLLASLGYAAPTGLLIWVSGRLYGQAGGLVFLLMALVGGSGLLLVPGLAGAGRRR